MHSAHSSSERAPAALALLKDDSASAHPADSSVNNGSAAYRYQLYPFSAVFVGQTICRLEWSA